MRRFNYIGLSLMAIGISIAISLLSSSSVRGQGEQSVPPAVDACIDSRSPFTAGGVELIATATVEDTNYYLIYTYESAPGSEQYPIALLVSSQTENTCQRELWNTPRDFLEYANYVPLDAAVKFREIEYSIQLERMSRAEFINAFDLSSIDLFPEEAEALQRLNVLDEIRSSQ